MKFWDASAIIPLLASEPPREGLLKLLEQDPPVVAWWGTSVEVAAALARREREKSIPAAEVEAALAAAHQLADGWHEILPLDSVRRTAARDSKCSRRSGLCPGANKWSTNSITGRQFKAEANS